MNLPIRPACPQGCISGSHFQSTGFERAIRKDIKLGAKANAVDKFIEAKLAVQVIEE